MGLEPSALSRTRRLRVVDSREKWGYVLARIDAERRDMRERRAPLDRLRSLYRFQFDVIEQVLLEHETLGAVTELSVEDTRTRPLAPPDISHLSAERLLFILAAHEVMAHADPTTARNRLLSGGNGRVGRVDAYVLNLVKQRPDDFVELCWRVEKKGGKGRARRLAETRPTKIYWSYADPAEDDDPPWEGKRDTRKYFDYALGLLYAEISAAGVRTVDDVVCVAEKLGSWQATATS